MATNIPIWLMKCTSDIESNQESIALDIIPKNILSRMCETWHAAILIDKNIMELAAIEKVIDVDPYC